MNVHALNQEAERFYLDGLLTAHKGCIAKGFLDRKTEAIKGLCTIVTLSMQCLEIMLKQGRIKETDDMNGLIQDNDPYVENLKNMVRKGRITQG